MLFDFVDYFGYGEIDFEGIEFGPHGFARMPKIGGRILFRFQNKEIFDV